MLTLNIDPECDACRFKKIHKPATTKSTHPNFQPWELCEDCANELNKRNPPYPEEGWDRKETE